MPVEARRERPERAAEAAAEPARKEPTKNAIANVIWMLIPSACTICAVVDAGTDHHPVRVFLSQSQRPSPTATRRRG